jgi:predicted Zn-dependent protease
MELMQLGEAGILAAVGAAKPQAVQMVGAALGLGAQLGVELPFSRTQESEADHIGLILMAKAGYDPSGAVDFWQRMTAYGKGKGAAAFLSDHPSNSDRVAAIQREMPEAKANFVAHR